ncbi:unnamed protein product, partial [Thlaspi arvense]
SDEVHLRFLQPPSLYHTDMYITDGAITFCLTYVYGNPNKQCRISQWQRMINHMEAGLYRSKPREILIRLGIPGEVNIFCALFRAMLNISGLHEIKTYGGRFTWLGQRHHHTVKSKIDRVVATSDWKDLYPKAYLDKILIISLCCYLLKIINGRVKSFSDMTIVGPIIQKFSLPWLIPGTQPVKIFPWKNSPQSSRNVEQICNLQHLLQQAYNSNPLDYNYIGNLKSKLLHEYRLEEEYLHTKSRIQWLQAGDRKTRYFHAQTQHRRSHNRITTITDIHGHLLHSTSHNSKLCQLLDPTDIPFILQIRPSLTNCEDSVSWIYTKDGPYSVKSGYNLLRANHIAAPDQDYQLHNRV